MKNKNHKPHHSSSIIHLVSKFLLIRTDIKPTQSNKPRDLKSRHECDRLALYIADRPSRSAKLLDRFNRTTCNVDAVQCNGSRISLQTHEIQNLGPVFTMGLFYKYLVLVDSITIIS